MICSLKHDCDYLLVNSSMILAVCEKLFAFESHVFLVSSGYRTGRRDGKGLTPLVFLYRDCAYQKAFI